MKVKATFTGPEHILGRLEDKAAVEAAAIEAAPPFLFRVSRAMAYSLRRTILTQGASSGVRWRPLAPSTRRRKGHSLILQDTRTLVWGVDVWKLRARKLPGYAVGFRRSRMHGPARMRLGALANIHEQGLPDIQGVRGRWSAWRIPARPFFVPTIQVHLEPIVVGRIAKFVNEMLHNLTKDEPAGWVTIEVD